MIQNFLDGDSVIDISGQHSLDEILGRFAYAVPYRCLHLEKRHFVVIFVLGVKKNIKFGKNWRVKKLHPLNFAGCVLAKCWKIFPNIFGIYLYAIGETCNVCASCAWFYSRRLQLASIVYRSEQNPLPSIVSFCNVLRAKSAPKVDKKFKFHRETSLMESKIDCGEWEAIKEPSPVAQFRIRASVPLKMGRSRRKYIHCICSILVLRIL